MNLLVTGGAGFIGSNLVRLLIHRGHSLLNVDKLTYAGNLASLSDVSSHPNYQFLLADICDPAAMRDAFRDFRPDAVLHLAAESHVDRSIDGPGTFIHTNITGTYTLLQASLRYWQSLPREAPGARPIEASKGEPGMDEPLSTIRHPQSQKSFRFLHVSTDEVYGSLGTSGRFTETTAYNPHSPYSATKAASDHLARTWHDTYGLPVMVTNCSNNYGPCQFPEKLIPVVLLKALRGEPIPVYGTGENIRDWLYVEDHAEALLAVLQHGQPGQTYNIGGNNELKNLDLVRLLCRILDEELQKRGTPSSLTSGLRPPSSESLITFVTDRPGHDLRYAIDASKIRDQLGWQPKQDHQSGFRKTVAWYLDHQDWWQAILDGSYQLQRLGTA